MTIVSSVLCRQICSLVHFLSIPWHFKKSWENYKRLAGELTIAKPELLGIKKIGHDLDKATARGTTDIFKDADNVWCTKHSQEHDALKLKSLSADELSSGPSWAPCLLWYLRMICLMLFPLGVWWHCMQMTVETSRVIQCPYDHESFQEDLNNPASWAQKNQRSFSTKKCKLLQITCKWSPISAPLLPDGTPLEGTTEFSDLELLTDYKLSWNSHIDKIASKANKVLGLIERNCRDLRDISMLRTRYCTLVRLQLKFYGHPSLPEIFWSWKECNIELWSLS